LAEIQNPNQQGGGQDSRTILVFGALFFLVFIGLQYFRSKKAPEPIAPQPAAVQQQTAQTQTPAAAQSASAPSDASTSAATVAAVAAASESTTVVENELYRVTFSNRGAQVTSWILKKYTDDDGKPLDLVNHQAAAKLGYPLSLFTYDAGLRGKLAAALYVPSATGNVAAPNTLSFDYSAGGLVVHKTFGFDNTYVIHATVTVTNNGSPVTALLSWPAGFGDQITLPQYAAGTLDISQSGKSDQLALKKVIGGNTLRGPFDYAGVSDQYFTAAFLPDDPSNANVVTLHNTIDVPRNLKKPEPGQVEQAPVLGAAIGSAAGPVATKIFVGPKDLDVLGSIHTASGENLEKIVHFGDWLGIIAKPLFLLLRFLHDHVIANWGWAILLLTVVLNLAMLPTRLQMMKSSLKMQRIQPEMEVIKAKYAKYKATDPRKQEMQREIMDLQKREGVNMFGGCLPMLIQWPLLFAFYRVLGNAIELRHAHWLWLHDLSAPDPWHILPVFVIVSMFLTQYFTPSSPGMDPAQQKMMAFTMPAVFGIFMWNYGSGLSLYWACSNLIGVAQQMVMNRTSLGREIREIAAKRAAKKNGKVINARR
jgi:YidC/Oxa1 family membrane protein insertase